MSAEYQTMDYAVRYRPGADQPLILFNETDDQEQARIWANRLWSMGMHEVCILSIEKKVLARKVRE